MAEHSPGDNLSDATLAEGDPRVTTGARIRVLIVDDYPIYARGVVECLSAEPDVECVGTTSSGPNVLEAIRELSPDVVVLDVFPPGNLMPPLVQRIRGDFPGVRMLAIGDLSMDLLALKLVRAGVDGYLLKDCDSAELGRAIRVVNRGEAYFTPSVASAIVHHFRLLSESPRRLAGHDDGLTERELKVLDLLARGKSNREIAEILCLSERTVENHARNIYGKLHVHDRTQAILVAQQKGYVKLLGSPEQAAGNGFLSLYT